MKLSKFLLLPFCLIFLVSCNKEVGPQYTNKNNSTEFQDGFWIINEGTFNFGNASLSFYNNKSNKIDNRIFNSVNNKPLGDVFQSILFTKDTNYLVLNNSDKIVICNKKMEQIDEVTAVLSPRYTCKIDNKILITSFKKHQIIAYNLDTKEQTTFAETESWTENIFTINNMVYVIQKNIGFSNSSKNKLLKFDNNGTKVKELVLNNPISDIKKTTDNKFVVLTDDNGKSILNFIDTDLTNTSLPLEDKNLKLSVDEKNNIFTIGDNILKIDKQNKTIDSLFSINNKIVYGFKVYQNKIYITDAKDYVQNGDLLIYSLNGELIDSVKTGIIPSEIYF